MLTPNFEDSYCNPTNGINLEAKQMLLTILPNNAFSSPSAMVKVEYPKMPVSNKHIKVRNTFIFIVMLIK